MEVKIKHKFRFDISIWMVISAIAVLAVISAILTLTHFRQQKEQAIELLLEKGTTLIRSFEAGLRSHNATGENIFPLQKLLMETAEQPDIDYIIITDRKGNILADSDPSMVGRQYGLDLDTLKIAASKDKKWRQAVNPEGAGTFEVYRGFFPQERFNEKQTAKQTNGSMIIYVGLNMAKIEKADKMDTRNTIILALSLLLIGSSAIISLFLVQTYRSTRSSLSRMTVFSETLVRNMPIGLIALDENDNIATCNEKAGAILSIDCAGAAGKPARSVLPGPVQKILDDLPVGGLLENDLQLTPVQNENKTLEVIAAELTSDKVSIGKLMLLRDVTALRQLESEVAKSRHLNSIASLAAGVAHEIRNPLSSIKGFAVYFKERLSGNTEDQKIAETIIQEVERLNRVISQLIEFARPLQLKMEKTALTDLIHHTLNLIDADLKKNQIEVELNEAAVLPVLKADSDKVKQVLLNVFLNSLAAMKNGGKLTIKFLTGKDRTTVIIADTGVGIDKMDLPLIYDPYFTSKPAGTGLGLAVVQKIMEAHGGAIAVESETGKGTTVYLQFPLH